MTWDRNDYYTAAFLIGILLISILVALILTGAFDPRRITTVFPFR